MRGKHQHWRVEMRVADQARWPALRPHHWSPAEQRAANQAADGLSRARREAACGVRSKVKTRCSVPSRSRSNRLWGGITEPVYVVDVCRRGWLDVWCAGHRCHIARSQYARFMDVQGGESGQYLYREPAMGNKSQNPAVRRAEAQLQPPAVWEWSQN